MSMSHYFCSFTVHVTSGQSSDIGLHVGLSQGFRSPRGYPVLYRFCPWNKEISCRRSRHLVNYSLLLKCTVLTVFHSYETTRYYDQFIKVFIFKKLLWNMAHKVSIFWLLGARWWLQPLEMRTAARWATPWETWTPRDSYAATSYWSPRATQVAPSISCPVSNNTSKR